MAGPTTDSPGPWRRVVLSATAALGLATGTAMAQSVPTASAPLNTTDTEPLPASIRAALARARIDPQGLYVWVAPADGQGPVRLSHQSQVAAQPASVMKLVTAMVALERLGPLFQWHTPVYTDAAGNVYLQGRGDPKLVNERVWLLLRQVMQAQGPVVRGDWVLDRSAFAIPTVDAGAFDGEPLKPYNVRPDALMVNQKSLVLSFKPDPAQGVARLQTDTPLARVTWPDSVPLGTGNCPADWRSTLGLDLSDPEHPRFTGRYAAACGERNWPLAWPDPASFNARALEAQWQAMGGTVQGTVRDGVVPTGLVPVRDLLSPTLPDVLRDMNKYSNNMIAQHVLLALSPGQPQRPARWEDAREQVQALALAKGCQDGELVIDNGSGLSRQERLSARCLGSLLQWAWRRPWMPELLSSLPVAGAETTARRVASAGGQAHLKTGSLDRVVALAGIVHPAHGRRQVMVAILNHPQAGSPESRAVLDAVVRWTLQVAEPLPGEDGPASADPAASSPNN